MEIDKSISTDDLNPLQFYLGQNYPNPAQKSTSIKYCIPYKSFVQIRIFNDEGDEVDVLLNEEKKPGTYRAASQYRELCRRKLPLSLDRSRF